MNKEEMKNNLTNAISGLSTAYDHTKRMDAEKKEIRKFILDAYKDYLDTKEMVLNVVNENLGMLKAALEWNVRSGYPYHGICYDRYFKFGGIEIVFLPVDGKGFDGHYPSEDYRRADNDKMFPKANAIRFTIESRDDCSFKDDLLNNYNTSYLPIKDILDEKDTDITLEMLLLVRKYAEKTAIRTKFLYDGCISYLNKVAERYRNQVSKGLECAGDKYVKVCN